MGAVLHGPGEGERHAVGPSEAIIKATSDSDAQVRFLNLSTPGGWEAYMRELSQAVASDGMTPEVLESLSKRHDVKLA
jgi:hypothetical protein